MTDQHASPRADATEPIDPTDPAVQPVGAPSRRTVMRVTGAAGAVALGGASLAACGTSAGGNGSLPTATPVSGIPMSEVPVRGGRIIANVRVVVTQPEAGTFKAFGATCPHEGCVVSEVVKNVIVCPCHGSTFDASTGARIAGPAPTGLTPLTLTESGTTLDVS